MATISLAGAHRTFNMLSELVTYNLATKSNQSTTWSWVSPAISQEELGNGVSIYASTFFNYGNDAPANGLVKEVRVTLDNAPGAADFVATGLSFDVGLLAPMQTNSAFTAADDNELFWRTVLSGADTIDFGSAATTGHFSIRFAGDGRSVLGTANVVGRNDSFTGDIGNGLVAGDYLRSEALTRVVGGNDTMVLRGGDPFLVNPDLPSYDDATGDVAFVYGRLIGGDDVLTDRGADTLIFSGDAYEVYSTGTVFGGNDTISGGTGAFGDALYVTNGSLFGGNDTLYGSDEANKMSGDILSAVGGVLRGGNDTIYGYGGNDLIAGDAFLIDINGSTSSRGGDDVIWGGAGNDQLTGDAGFGIGGNDVIYAESGDDELAGEGGNDWLDGGEGNDTLFYYADGYDVMVGGSGTDRADFRYLDKPIWVDIIYGGVEAWIRGTTLQSGPWTAVADLVTIENLTGSEFGDYLRGDNGANKLTGRNGDDELRGEGGNDVFEASGGGLDRVYGGSGTDRLEYNDSTKPVWVHLAEPGVQAFTRGATLDTGTWTGITIATEVEDVAGSKFGDYLRGDAGSNWIQGGLGDDKLVYGGGAFDWLWGDGGTHDMTDFSPLDRPVWVDLDAAGREVWTRGATLTSGTWVETADLQDVEDLTGSAFADYLEGNAVANFIAGGEGADTITGGLGSDIFTGGGGADTYVYRTLGEVTSTLGADTITDFATGSDKIDLTLIDADVVTAGQQHLQWSTTGAAAGKVYFDAVAHALLIDIIGTSGTDTIISTYLSSVAQSDVLL